MKVKVLKEIPFVGKPGNIIKTYGKTWMINGKWYSVEDLIKDGWLSEVKKALEACKVSE